MTQIELSEKFKNPMKKIKDERIGDRVKKELKNLLKDSTIGKPLRYSLKRLERIRLRFITVRLEINHANK